MTPSVRLVGRFALAFVLVMAVLAAVWSFIAPRYAAAVTAAAQPAFRWVEHDDVTVLGTQDDQVWVYRRVGENRVAPFMFLDRYAFFALVPLVALFVATPGLRILRRIAFTLCGTSILFFVHVAYVVASVELSYAAGGLNSGGPLPTAQWLLRLVWEAAPVAIWLLFTAASWVRSLRALRASAGTGRIMTWTAREGRNP